MRKTHEVVFLVKDQEGTYSHHPHPPADGRHAMLMSKPAADEFVSWWEGQRASQARIDRALNKWRGTQ